MFFSLKVVSRRIAGHTTLTLGALVTAFALTAAPTQAAPITFTYEGAVSSTSGGVLFDAFLGQTATLEYSFDDATPDTNGSATAGSYALTSASLTIGSNVYTSIGNLSVTNGASDSYSFSLGSSSGPDIGALSPASIFLNMTDITATALSSDALPTTQPDPTDFAFSNNFGIDFSGGGLILIDTFTIANEEVPEPGALIIFGFSLAGLGYMRRRRTA